MKKTVLCVLCILMLCLSAGCTNYRSIRESLAEIEVENIMPEVSLGGYDSLDEANDEIYELQLAVCEMYADAHNQTQYEHFAMDFEDEEEKDQKIMEMCNERRMELAEEIRVEFFKNLFRIIDDCEDCENKDAFLTKADNHVMDFYDIYYEYLNAEDEGEVLCKMLVNYAERRNTLALSFLERSERKVYEAATKKIEENAETDENYRYYLNKNNYIISALNRVFGGVPSAYAARITDATTKLSKNLLESYDDLTEYERAVLIDELDLSTPTPEPSTAVHSRAEQKSTPVPVQTPVPAIRVTPRPTTAPTKVPATQAPTATEGPSYSFSVE